MRHIVNIIGFRKKKKIIEDLKSRKTLNKHLLKKLNVEFRDITEHLDTLPNKEFWKEKLESSLVSDHEVIYFYSILFLYPGDYVISGANLPEIDLYKLFGLLKSQGAGEKDLKFLLGIPRQDLIYFVSTQLMLRHKDSKMFREHRRVHAAFEDFKTNEDFPYLKFNYQTQLLSLDTYFRLLNFDNIREVFHMFRSPLVYDMNFPFAYSEIPSAGHSPSFGMIALDKIPGRAFLEALHWTFVNTASSSHQEAMLKSDPHSLLEFLLIQGKFAVFNPRYYLNKSSSLHGFMKVSSLSTSFYDTESGDMSTLIVHILENNNTTLLEALAIAGGISTGKAKRIKLIRGDLKDPKVYLIDL